MCLTYGRVELLEEALQCFLYQDYSGIKELIILNDLDAQTLVFEHPEVHVINLPKRFRTVGEKRNACAALASHDLLLVWDDDDIYFPYRISQSVQKMQEQGLRFYKPNVCFGGDYGRIARIMRSYALHASACFTRELFNQVGGYPIMSSGQDMVFHKRCRMAGAPTAHLTRYEEIFYFYRWGQIRRHLSQYWELSAARTERFDPEAYVKADLENDLRNGRQPQGKIQLMPHFKHDYQAMRQHLLDNTKGNRDEPVWSWLPEKQPYQPLVFLALPGNASTTLKTAMSDFDFINYYHPGESAPTLAKYRQDSVMFCLRDPISRFISIWRLWYERGFPYNDKDWRADSEMDKIFERYTTPERYLQAVREGQAQFMDKGPWSSQTELLGGLETVSACLDRFYHVFQQEQLQDTFNKFCDGKLLAPSHPLPFLRSADHQRFYPPDITPCPPDYRQLSTDSVAQLKRSYHDDFTLLARLKEKFDYLQ